MKRLIAFLSVATLAAVLSAPLAALTLRVTAHVPFDFMVAGRSMPAGDYDIGDAGLGGSAAVKVSNGNSGVMSFVNNSSLSSKERTGQALLIFHRYGDQYFLSRIVDGYRDTGVEIPTSTTEKELSRTASLEKFETITVLARR
jgi:hypothetical protein